jgi:hypothetical protein
MFLLIGFGITWATEMKKMYINFASLSNFLNLFLLRQRLTLPISFFFLLNMF